MSLTSDLARGESAETEAVEPWNQLKQRLEALFAEVRRQGRAGIAAQAAAEGCLRSIEQLQETLAQRTEPQPAAAVPAGAEVGASENTRQGVLVETVETLLPVFDALDGAVRHARRLIETRSSGGPPPPASAPGSLLRRMKTWIAGPTPAEASDPELQALAHGILLLQAELRRGLKQLGIEVDDAAGVRVDVERHRVLQAQAASESDSVSGAPIADHGTSSAVRPEATPAATFATQDQALVLEVLRPGYRIAARCIREADVVVGSPNARSIRKNEKAHD